MMTVSAQSDDYSLPDLVEMAGNAIRKSFKKRQIVKIHAKKSVDEFDNPIAFIYVTLNKFDPVEDANKYLQARNDLIFEASRVAFPILYILDPSNQSDTPID